jgi:branched-subunit amino acid aminotransferase/4-amino-4-deoxychorismate lyase
MQQKSYFSRNGELLPLDQAVVSLDNLEYSYGFGVYETMKVRKEVLYFVEQHVDRLFLSAGLIRLSHPFTKLQIITWIRAVVSENHLSASNIKMLLIGGKTSADAQLYILPLAPLFPDRKLYKTGVDTITFQYERYLPNAKSLNMLPSYLIYRQAQEAGCYDGLLIDRDGSIREGTRTNFFTIRGNTIISPPSELILEGVTRKTILHVARVHGYSYQEALIPYSSIHSFDGAFLTSTSTKIVPVRRIDSHVFPAAPAAVRQLMKHYDLFLSKTDGVFPP